MECSNPEVGILVNRGLGGGDFLVYIDLSVKGESIGFAALSLEQSGLVLDFYVFILEDDIVGA